MNDKFFDLKKEKQDRMINASLKIFALNGYQHASTDDIVKEAGISKGLLFHYFGSKLGLYTFLADYSVRYMILEISTGVNGKESDYFILMKEIEIARLQALKNYPYMQFFLLSCEQENVIEALAETREQRDNLNEIYRGIREQVDTARFQPDVDFIKLDRMIQFTLSGIMNESIRDGSFQPEHFYSEVRQYLMMMNSIAYK